MSPNTEALVVGASRLSYGTLGRRLAEWSGDIRDGQIVPLRSANATELVVAALAVRQRGGVPAIGDVRWSERHWEELTRSLSDVVTPSGAAWATFSSGSTGAPRVILRDESSWALSFPAVTRLMNLTSSDVVLLPSPLVSSLSMFSIVHALDAGATVLLPEMAVVSPLEWEQATILHGTPGALESVLDLLDAGTPIRLRLALIGGAHLDAGLRARAEAAGIRVVSYYGAAELSFVAVDENGNGLRPFDGVELRILDGELQSRSPYVALGYLPGHTGSFRKDAAGWASVGDLARISTDGILTLSGRRDGAILTAAATVVPEDVEKVLRTLDGVKNSVVFGEPNPRLGSLVCAVIEVEDAANPPTSAALRAACRDRLSVAQVPRRWYLATEIARTATGKPARARIAQDAIDERMPRLA
ncbi:class I adenylate-forming enzyme family protein [Mycetocola zhujimingii]|uniref:class I adenylate-forming enzyme family protein n=1 Tax=Mycetocola zhujimingii TaxID=2079792 RepID=UPI001E2B8242|nr:AMP-binding protein [Mycetocola zhujimingii]